MPLWNQLNGSESGRTRAVALALWLMPLLALAIIFRGVIFYNQIFFNGDSFVFYDYFLLLKRGAPWLVEHLLSGFPLHASVNGAWYSVPSRVLLYWFDHVTANHLLIFCNLVLTYTATYWYARLLGLRAAAAITAGSVFLFSGQLMMWSTVVVNTNYYYLLPLALVCVEYARRRRNPILLYIVAGAVLGLGWLGGHIQFVAYIHVFIALYAFLMVWWSASEPFWRYAVRVSVLAITSAAVGFAQLFPIISLAPYTAREHGVGLAGLFTGAYSLQDLLHYLLPFWDTPLLHAPIPNLYIGILPLLLLLFGFRIRKRIARRQLTFYLWTWVVSLVAAFKYSPIALLLYQLPFFSAFRSTPRIMFIGNFAAALAVASILEYCLEHRTELHERLQRFLRSSKSFFTWFVVPPILLATVAEVYLSKTLAYQITVLFERYRYAQTSRLPIEHYANLIQQYVNATLHSISVTNGQVSILILAFGASLALLSALHRMPKAKAEFLVVALIVGNFVLVYGGYFVTVHRVAAVREPRSVAVIRSLAPKEPFRIFSVLPGMTIYNELVVRCPWSSPYDRLQLSQELLEPNGNIVHRLDSIDGYENFMTARMAEVLAFVGSERATAGDLLAQEPIPAAERVQKLRDRLSVLQAMNVRFIVSSIPMQHELLILRDQYLVTECKSPVYVYELLNPWPRFVLTNAVMAIPEEATTFKSVQDLLVQSSSKRAVLLGADDVVSAVATGTPIFEAIEPSVQGDKRVFYSAHDTPTIFAIGNAWLPGWQALIDDTPVPILRANYAYMGVLIPPGSHTITLQYTPNPFEWQHSEQ